MTLYDRMFELPIVPPLPALLDPPTQRAAVEATRKSTPSMRDTSLRGSEIYDISNVAALVRQRGMTPEDIAGELACLAPPFIKIWMEWDIGSVGPHPARRMGVSIQFVTREQMLSLNVSDPTIGKWFKQGTSLGLKWALMLREFVEFKPQPDMFLGTVRGPYSDTLIPLGERGEILGPPGRELWPNVTAREGKVIADHASVALYALALLNCDNVTDETHAPPAKLNKSRKKKGKQPLVRYKTIKIDPFATHAPARGASTGTGGKVARHKRAGGIRDYTQGKGLFGRVHGRFYFGPCLVGDANEGIVISDYSIEPSEKK